MSDDIPELPHDKDYHFFVIYATENSEEVRLIIENLEELGVKCCYHERDFTPGASTIENMTISVEKSENILIVLSKDYERSNFCNYETRTALHSKIKSGNFIIPLKLEPCTVPKYLQGISYIDAADGELGNIPNKILDALIKKEWQKEENTGVNGETLSIPLPSIKNRCWSLRQYSFSISHLHRHRIMKRPFKVSDEQLDIAEMIINNSLLIRYLHIFENHGVLTKRIFVISYILTLCIFLSTLTTCKTPKEPDHWIGVELVLVSVLGAVVGVILNVILYSFIGWNIGRLVVHAKNNVNKTLWSKINSSNYMKNKTLLFYTEKQLKVMRYNTRPCKEYFQRLTRTNPKLLEGKREDQTLEEYTDMRFERYLRLKIEFLGKADFTRITRHTTVNVVPCLCLQVEKYYDC